MVSTETQSHSSTFPLPSTIKLLKGLFSSQPLGCHFLLGFFPTRLLRNWHLPQEVKQFRPLGSLFCLSLLYKTLAPQLPALLAAVKSSFRSARPRRLPKTLLGFSAFWQLLSAGFLHLSLHTAYKLEVSQEWKQSKCWAHLIEFPALVNLGPSSPGCLGSFPIPSNRLVGFLYLAFLVVLSWSGSAISWLTISECGLFSNYVFIKHDCYFKNFREHVKYSFLNVKTLFHANNVSTSLIHLEVILM